MSLLAGEYFSAQAAEIETVLPPILRGEAMALVDSKKTLEHSHV